MQSQHGKHHEQISYADPVGPRQHKVAKPRGNTHSNWVNVTDDLVSLYGWIVYDTSGVLGGRVAPRMEVLEPPEVVALVDGGSRQSHRCGV